MTRKKICLYLLLGLLILGIVGVVYYFWWQKQETGEPQGTLVEHEADTAIWLEPREKDVMC